MAKVMMVQGTMSNAGKSLIVAGLCRIFKRDGFKVAPFKSQNMALNSFATIEGLEIGRAQAMQAEAAGIEPSVNMNPVLLKPTGDSMSQVIVNGRSIGNMTAREYFKYKLSLIPEINIAFRELNEEYDIIVIEGAGSPAEINLREKDIVNMGLADMVDAPVILLGDIDRGGVFAQLYGTYMLLSEREKELLKGVVINKFRGDKTLLDPGIEMMSDKMPVPFVGVLPYMSLNLDDEDSLTSRFNKRIAKKIDIVGIRLPRISNFTDLDVFEQFDDVSVRYIGNVEYLGNPDMIVIPGSKNTLADLKWLKDSGLGDLIKDKALKGIPIIGICGGYQMLGESVEDPLGVEEGGMEEGLSLLPVTTTLAGEKKTEQFEGICMDAVNSDFFGFLQEENVLGYEIHMGETYLIDDRFSKNEERHPLLGFSEANICGTYVHGVFDREGIAGKIVELLAEKKGLVVDTSHSLGRRAYKEKEYDKLADMILDNMDMEAIYGMLSEANVDWKY